MSERPCDPEINSGRRDSHRLIATQYQYFNKIFIGIQDKIIPAKNQINFWSQNKELKIIKLNEGHCIFKLFKSWDEIIGFTNYE